MWSGGDLVGLVQIVNDIDILIHDGIVGVG